MGIPEAGPDARARPGAGPLLNLHAILPRSRANGPGARVVIWFQGCTLGCPGCFNPDTHAAEPRLLLPAAAVVARVVAASCNVEGISLSGGEPLQQPEGLLALLEGVRERTELSVLLFSGYTLAEIRAMPTGPRILALADVLIAGRYVRTRPPGAGLRGSANQSIHLLTGRYTLAEVEETPPAEVILHPDGSITFSGIADPGCL
ncbi:MAG: radical SAM protein [Armatimonadetes bacterium]|nr:radical SAM protein [Armatimonadota bacterium]